MFVTELLTVKWGTMSSSASLLCQGVQLTALAFYTQYKTMNMVCISSLSNSNVIATMVKMIIKMIK